MASLSTKDENQNLSKEVQMRLSEGFCYVHDFILYH